MLVLIDLNSSKDLTVLVHLSQGDVLEIPS